MKVSPCEAWTRPVILNAQEQKEVINLTLLNNYWMRLSMISKIIQTEADSIDRGLDNS